MSGDKSKLSLSLFSLDVWRQIKTFTFTIFSRCLETAYEEENLEIVRYLLNDYDCLRVDEFSNAFCKDGIVLLFEIFQNSKVYIIHTLVQKSRVIVRSGSTK